MSMRNHPSRTSFITLAVAAFIASSGCATAARGHLSPEQKRIEKAFNQAWAKGEKSLKQDLATLGQVAAAFRAAVARTWGKNDAKVADRTVFVKYTEHYHTRASVDFEHGTIAVETLDGDDPRGSLKKALVATLLTPGDPRAVDLFSDAGVKIDEGREPYLAGLVVDEKGRPVRVRADAERYADWLVANRVRTHAVEGDEGTRTAHVVKIAMVANFSHKNAEKYRSAVARSAERYKVSQSLVFAIIRTESNFNPFAVSPVPAFGLMQLVPKSGGRDAYRRAKGIDQAPSTEYLFDADNNIELGAAYLDLLTSAHLGQITNPVAREYCVIAAYNTGAGNVLKTFGPDRAHAIAAINALGPDAVFERLRRDLPYEETRQYVGRVVGYRRQFLNWDAGTAQALASR